MPPDSEGPTDETASQAALSSRVEPQGLAHLERVGEGLLEVASAAVPWPLNAPFAGASAVLERRMQRRLAIWQEAIVGQLERLEDSKIDRDYLRSPDFRQLVETAVEGLQHTRTEATIRYQAAVLLGALRPGPSKVDPGTLLAVLEQLTAAELDVLRIIWEANREHRAIPVEVLAAGMGAPPLYGSTTPDVQHWEFLSQRLEALGLVTIFGTRETRHSPRGYEVTSAFDALLSVVADVDELSGGAPGGLPVGVD